MPGRDLLRTGAVIVLAQLFIALVGLLSLRVYTTLVPPNIFGAANLLLGLLALGLQVFTAGVTATLLRYLPEAVAKGTGNIFAAEARDLLLRVVLVLSAVFGATAIAASRYTSESVTLTAAGAAICWLILMSLRNLLLSKIQAERQQVAYAGFQVLEVLAMLAATVGTLHRFPTTAGYLFGQALGIGLAIVAMTVASTSIRQVLSSPSPPRGEFRARARAYGLAFAPMSALSWLGNSADRYTLGSLLGADAVGRYVPAFSVASRGLILLATALCDLFRPLLFDAESRGDHAKARIVFRQWLLVSGAIGLVAVILLQLAGPFLSRLLLAEQYRDGAVMVMFWISLAYAAYGINQILENRLLSIGHSGRLLLPMSLGACGNVGFSLLLVGSHGIVGAAQASFASFVLQCLVTAWFLRGALRRRMGSMEAPGEA